MVPSTRAQTASLDGALKVTTVGSGIGVEGETRRPGLDGAGVRSVEVPLGVWVETGLPVVEVQALHATATNATEMMKGASLGELTISINGRARIRFLPSSAVRLLIRYGPELQRGPLTNAEHKGRPARASASQRQSR
jgi:hypothetical protein